METHNTAPAAAVCWGLKHSNHLITKKSSESFPPDLKKRKFVFSGGKLKASLADNPNYIHSSTVLVSNSEVLVLFYAVLFICALCAPHLSSIERLQATLTLIWFNQVQSIIIHKILII